MRRDVSPKALVPYVVIFTDLDGTLLDHETYGWKEAKPALNLCKALKVPLILVSSKTRAEMNLLRHELELTSPFISENGGGIFFPEEGSHPVPLIAFLRTACGRGRWGCLINLWSRRFENSEMNWGGNFEGFQICPLKRSLISQAWIWRPRV